MALCNCSNLRVLCYDIFWLSLLYMFLSDGNLSGPSENLNVDLNKEQRETKRVRKPTKRYIEEISEVGSRESSGRLLSTAKNFEAVDLGKANPKQEVHY